jgi:hypothetical protein
MPLSPPGDPSPAKKQYRGNPARKHRAFKVRLPTRETIDHRSFASKQFSAIAEAIYSDMGGRDQCSAVTLRLIEAFCGAAVLSEAMNVQLMLGEAVNHNDFCQVASTLCRIGSRLGLHRRPRDVNVPSLARYLSETADAEPLEAAQ